MDAQEQDHNGVELLVDALIDWGIDTVFGMPGDGINGVMEALRTRAGRIRFVQVRHEEAAAFMACAHAKWTGRLGCCLATTGPGGAHLLNGLYDARLDHAPVLAITGLPYHDLADTFTQQDVDLPDDLSANIVDLQYVPARKRPKSGSAVGGAVLSGHLYRRVQRVAHV